MICGATPNGYYTIEVYDSEAAWLAARIKSIGASDMPALFNLSPWCGRFGLYMRKTELATVSDDGEPLADMREAGHRHERTIVEWFEEQTKLRATDLGPYTICRSVERPYLHSTLDRLIVDQGSPLEVKCAWYDAGKVWSKRIPIAYQLQAQQHIYVTGADKCYFAVLIDGYKFRWYRINRHEKIIARLCAYGERFMERVARKDPPPITGDSTALKHIFKLYPEDKGTAVDLSPEAAAAAAELAVHEQALRQLTLKAQELKGLIQLEMKTHAYGILPSGGGFSWKKDARGARPFKRVENVYVEPVTSDNPDISKAKQQGPHHG